MNRFLGSAAISKKVLMRPVTTVIFLVKMTGNSAFVTHNVKQQHFQWRFLPVFTSKEKIIQGHIDIVNGNVKFVTHLMCNFEVGHKRHSRPEGIGSFDQLQLVVVPEHGEDGRRILK